MTVCKEEMTMTKAEVELVLAKKAYTRYQNGVLTYECISDKDDGEGYCFVALENDVLWITATYERLLTDDFTIVMPEDCKG